MSGAAGVAPTHRRTSSARRNSRSRREVDRVRVRLAVAVAALASAAIGLVPIGAAGGFAPADATSLPRPLRIWPLGDSITVGFSEPQSSPGGYRTVLDQVLSQVGTAHRFVGSWSTNSSVTLDLRDQSHHDGHNGYRVDQVRRDLDAVAHGETDIGGRWLTRAAQPLNPDVALVLLGTNDIVQRWDTRRFATRDGRVNLGSARQRGVFVADLTGRLADLVLRIHILRPRAAIVVATVLPIELPAFARAADDYAAAVRRLVGQLSARRLPVVLADAYSAFEAGAPPGHPVAAGLLCDDEVHPTAAGYAVLAHTFASVLQRRTLPVSVPTDERP
jgi:lysophospholipase L1-like esterase